MATMLDAVINLKDNFSSTIQTVEKNIGSLSRTSKTMGRDIQRTGKTVSAIGGNLTKSLTVPLVGVIAASAKLGIDFEKTMSGVKAVTGATGKEFEDLEKKAREMGEKTTKSSSQAAEAMEYMGLAGWDTTQIMDGIEPILRLAEAGNLDLARASDLVTDSMSAMRIEVKDLPQYLDVVAKAASSSNTDIDAMMEAYLAVGGVLAGLDVPLEESAVSIGMLANAGLKGSEGGKKLSSILTNLTAPAGKAKKALDKLNFSAFDSEGNFKGLDNILFDLKDRLKDLTPEQQNMYKSMIAGKENIDGLNALLNGLDDSYESLTEEISNSEGALKTMADIMNDNTAGSISRLLSALQEVGLKIYDTLKPAIAEVIEYFQKFTDKLNNLTPEQQEMITKLVKLAIVLGPILMLIGGLTSKIGGAVTEFGFFAARVKNLGLKAAILTPGAKVVLILGAIVGVAILVYKNWDKIKSAADKLIERFPIITDVANTLKNALVFMKDKIIELKDKFIEFKDRALIDVKEKFTDFFNMLEENKETIKTLATVILVALAPAMVNTGIQALLSGAQVVGGFVASLIATAAQAVITGATITANLIGSLISYVVQGWVTVANIIATTAAWIAQKAIMIATSIATGIMTAAQWLLNGAMQVIKIIGYTAAWLAQKAMLVLSAIATGLMTAAQWLLNASIQVIKIIAYTAAWLAQKAILLITTVATGAMTAAQWLLNAALSANPITIVVILLVALGAAMVVAYKKSETFRNIVNKAWNAIKTTASTVTGAVKKGWNSVTDVFDKVSTKVSDTAESIKKAWEGVKTFLKNPIKGTVSFVKDKLGIGNNYKGTDNWKGGLTWVHEKGAEIMDLPGGTRIYPHDKSLQMARLQGQEQAKIKNQIPKVKEVTQRVRQKLESVKIPKISDVTQTIKQKVKGKPIQPFSPRNQEIIPLERNRETKIIEKNNNKKLEVTIAKLADQIVIREEADIDKITAKLVKKIEEADLNMA